MPPRLPWCDDLRRQFAVRRDTMTSYTMKWSDDIQNDSHFSLELGKELFSHDCRVGKNRRVKWMALKVGSVNGFDVASHPYQSHHFSLPIFKSQMTSR